MSDLNKKIIIIGAGISGISCALILEKLGFDVIIYSKDKPLGKPISPSHVSLYPAASIIPHSVSHVNVNTILQHSLSFFEQLSSARFPGLVTHKHFELFSENKKDAPDYSTFMKKFRMLGKSELDYVPNHPDIPLSSGWEFECYFADWGFYFPSLVKKFEQSSGSIITKEISYNEIEFLESDIIINCAEINGPNIAGEEFYPILQKGHIINIKGVPSLTDSTGKTISYNFTPPLEFYQSELGYIQDLYCYPCHDGLILGGSRQTGTLSNTGVWVGEEVIEPFQKLDNRKFPEQIISIQQQIIKSTFGVNLDSYPDKSLKIGYRFMGNKTEGLRLDSEEKFNKLIVHNYGHGGAGVTLSWGCAFDVASVIMKRLTGNEPDIEMLASLFS